MEILNTSTIVFGDFNAAISTERAAGYELYVGSYGSGNRNNKSSFLLNLARSRKIEDCRLLVSETSAAPLDLV